MYSVSQISQLSGKESREQMQKALQADSYKKAHEMREKYMRETSVGIHSGIVDKTLKLV